MKTNKLVVVLLVLVAALLAVIALLFFSRLEVIPKGQNDAAYNGQYSPNDIELIQQPAYEENHFSPMSPTEQEASPTVLQEDDVFVPEVPTKVQESTSAPEPEAPAQESIQVSVNGEDHTFYLESACLNGKVIFVDYIAYTPRGTQLYELNIALSEDISVGDYKYKSSNGSFNIAITNEFNEFGTATNANDCRDQGSKASLSITSRDDSWTEYTGHFEATLTDDNYYHVICDEFHFVITDFIENSKITDASRRISSNRYLGATWKPAD